MSDCGAFDSGLCIHPDGLASPCCVFDKNYFIHIDDLDWNDPWKNLKDGRGCSECQRSGVTPRDYYNQWSAPEFAVRYLDIRNTNTCNLECAICNPYYSSKWAERLGLEKFVSTDFDVPLEDIQEIYFAGGEPLLNPKHWQVLSSIKNPQDIGLRYSSNLSTVKGLEKFWPNFKHVDLMASIDGVYEHGEFMRPGLNFERWEQNLEEVEKFGNVDITLYVTVSLLNVFQLKDIETYSKHRVKFNYLTEPDYLCISSLPRDIKDAIVWPEQDDNLEWRNSLIQKDTSNLFEHSVSYTLLHDKVKNTNLWKYLPFEKYAIKRYMEY